MRLAVVTLGSAGDLHPYLAIAREMTRRGHEVRLLTQEPHRAAVEKEGVAFVPIVSERDHYRTLAHPRLWDPLGGFGVLWRHLCVPAIQPCFDALRDWLALADEPLTVFSSPLAVGARFAREALPIRLLTGYTAPSALRSCRDPMFLGAWQVPRWLPRLVREALWRGLDAWKLEPMVRARFAKHRATWQLGEQTGATFRDWIHGPDGSIGLFPEWFAAPADDWPVQPVLTGFPVFESGHRGDETHPFDTALETFLSAGSAPVVVSPGSAAFGASKFLSTAAEAARSLQRRCVVLSPYIDQWPTDSADGQLLCLAKVKLSALLPRAAALIHHGGIGTCAQAFSAGIPQLVLPSAYDQFDNGFRVERAGCGISLAKHREQEADSVKNHLAALLDQPTRPASAPKAALDRSATIKVFERPCPSFADAANGAVVRACDVLTAQR